MAATWITVGLTGLSLLGGLVGVLIKTLVKVSVAVAGNTQAINTLTEYMQNQDKQNACQDETLANHETRITRIEMVPEVKAGLA
jgi:hypothetical protein